MKEIDKSLINCDALKTSQSNLFSDKDHYFLMNHFVLRSASLQLIAILYHNFDILANS